MYIVFGASGGIGSSLVETLLAQKGASVVAAADDESGLKKFQDGDRSLALTCNVIDPDSVSFHTFLCLLKFLALSTEKVHLKVVFKSRLVV